MRLERCQMIVRGDALDELAQIRPRQQFAQLGLADQDDLQQKIAVRVDVRQQAQLLELLDADIVRLVDDDGDLVALGVAFDRELLEAGEALDMGPVIGLLEGHQHPFQELAAPGLDIRQKTDFDLAGELVEQLAHQGRLPGADIAGDHRQRCGVHQAVA